MTYKALPFTVEAKLITDIQPLEHGGILDVGALFGVLLILDDGTKVPAGKEMIVRVTPEAGDYFVSDSSDYQSILPRAVFLRKYHLASQ